MQKVTIELPDEIDWIFQMYAAILEDTLEHFPSEHLTRYAEDNYVDGEILGQEIRETYKAKVAAKPNEEQVKQ
jgi:hypothetical protein